MMTTMMISLIWQFVGYKKLADGVEHFIIITEQVEQAETFFSVRRVTLRDVGVTLKPDIC